MERLLWEICSLKGYLFSRWPAKMWNYFWIHFFLPLLLALLLEAFICVMLWCRISCNRRAGKEAVIYRISFHMYLFFVVALWKFNLLRPSINKYHFSELQCCGSEKGLGSLASGMLVTDLGNFFVSAFTLWGMKCPVYFVIVKSLPLQNRVVNTVFNCFRICLNVSYKEMLFFPSSSCSLMGLSIVVL